jgi:hypothetical protein
MSTESITPNPGQFSSFDEFKETILQHGADADLLNWAANKHGQIPRLIRVLHNIEPTGILSTIDQLFSEEVSEREKDNILRVIYDLAIRVWDIENREGMQQLPEDKFKFLYHVYVSSETDVYSRVEVDEIQKLMDITESRTISIGQYLEQNGFIKFSSWVEGIKILHSGIVKVETELLGSSKLPEFVGESEIAKIEERMRFRFAFLLHLFKLTGEDIFEKVFDADLANSMEIDHHLVITELLPYLAKEGWVRVVSNDSVSITEEGIDFAKALLSKNDTNSKD